MISFGNREKYTMRLGEKRYWTAFWILQVKRKKKKTLMKMGHWYSVTREVDLIFFLHDTVM